MPCPALTGLLNGLLPMLLSTACPAIPEIDPAALSGVLESARVEMELPGLRAAVRTPDGRIACASVGLADVEAGTPLTDTIGMPGGSTGKMFVAALAMLLVQDGKLSLEDPASQWLGGQRWFDRLPGSETFTVHHLLTHTSGIKDYPGTIRFNLSMIGRVIRHGSARYEPEELIGFVHGRRPLFPPGQGYRYSDAGYLVLGRLIETATGRDYYELLDSRILRPRGLDGIRPQDRSILTGVAIGYMAGARNVNKEGQMKFDPSSEWTGGGLITTPVMLVRFLGDLAEGRIVTRESLERMLKAGWRDPAHPDEYYGSGLFIWNQGRSFGHEGLWPGYRTRVEHDRVTGLTIAVQTNRDGRLDLEALTRRIARLLASSPAASPEDHRTPSLDLDRSDRFAPGALGLERPAPDPAAAQAGFPSALGRIR